MASPLQVGTAICTWFVGDEASEATFFPQIGMKSDAPEARRIYWRCVCCFFASSVDKNPGATHLFFTNVDLPSFDGVSVAEFLSSLRVKVVRLPITFRIRRSDILSWGNQFYILDIIRKLAADLPFDRYIVLDSDCLFTGSIDQMARKIDEHGVLTYDVGRDERASGEPVNGCSPEGMARYLARVMPQAAGPVVYCGGEIFACTHAQLLRIASQIDAFWAPIARGDDVEIREEAHFLSVIYACNGYAIGTANPFIKRMWTTFHYRNTDAADRHRLIWHLPAEKTTGFRDLFSRLASGWKNAPRGIGSLHSPGSYAKIMGVPRRHPAKFVRDFSQKLYEKFQPLRTS